ncbi:alpha-farnesene synthase-like isoform X2 [Cornus florida]|uniref:alpha-farnesene synthase-like isoform X2 n=1 Tax=Cornus florida TaxID=4283 RepID=UPI00289B0364|nr:alpha-farnesene synthase-like isoform X2 [Cornus florida]
MDCTNGVVPSDEQLVQCQKKAEAFNMAHQISERRSANYKPNIWKYELLQSLRSEYTDEEYNAHMEKQKEEIKMMFVKALDQVAKLELTDKIEKLGLSYLFEEEIKEALDNIVSNSPSVKDDLYATALCFRLLRQHGYSVSQDMFRGFVDEKDEFMKGTHAQFDVKAMIELFDASNLGFEGENILDDANALSSEVITKLSHEVELPLNWRVQWYNVRRQIIALEKEDNTNPILLELAKFNFNMVQAIHQKDLGVTARWWKNLGLAENLKFTRDRVVESYLWAVGVAFEPQFGNFRKWLTKAITFIIVIDDVYDVYGSLEELECFTNAVDRWDPKEVQHLPECMKICYEALYNTTNEVANEIKKEKGWNSVLPHLQKVGYTPSLQEYLDNGWISSSGTVLSLHALLSFTQEVTKEVTDVLENGHDLVYYTSLIIRLCNDLGTSSAELERGDAPSSILCFMREANVPEEIARKHIRSIIRSTWKKINSECVDQKAESLKPFLRYTTNTARVANFIYQNGDGFGVQDRETREQVLAVLIQPLPLKDRS